MLSEYATLATDLEKWWLWKKRPEIIDGVLETLGERETRILRMRFGLDGDEAMTLTAIAGIIGVSRERIGQIEAKALRKLRHPSRSVHLRECLP